MARESWYPRYLYTEQAMAEFLENIKEGDTVAIISGFSQYRHVHKGEVIRVTPSQVLVRNTTLRNNTDTLRFWRKVKRPETRFDKLEVSYGEVGANHDSMYYAYLCPFNAIEAHYCAIEDAERAENHAKREAYNAELARKARFDETPDARRVWYIISKLQERYGNEDLPSEHTIRAIESRLAIEPDDWKKGLEDGG